MSADEAQRQPGDRVRIDIPAEVVQSYGAEEYLVDADGVEIVVREEEIR